MTPNEFKAWFDGFTEAFEGRIPTKAQWSRIKDRVAEIDGKPVTERVYVDRYWPSYVKTYPSYSPNWTTTYCGGVSSASGTIASPGMISNATTVVPVSFNSMQAMSDLGRADAKALA